MKPPVEEDTEVDDLVGFGELGREARPDMDPALMRDWEFIKAGDEAKGNEVPKPMQEWAKKAGRHCGTCAACCYLMGVDSLTKLMDTWCDHCKKGSEKACQVYEFRPNECRDFVCGWLAGFSDLEDRPDRAGGVIIPETKANQPTISVMLMPHRDPSTRLKRYMEAMRRKGGKVWVRRGLTVFTMVGKNQFQEHRPSQVNQKGPSPWLVK